MEFTNPCLDSPPTWQSIRYNFGETVSGRLHARLLQPSHERFVQGAPTSARGGDDLLKFKALLDRTAVFPDLRKSTRTLIEILTISIGCPVSTAACYGRVRERCPQAPMPSPNV